MNSVHLVKFIRQSSYYQTFYRWFLHVYEKTGWFYDPEWEKDKYLRVAAEHVEEYFMYQTPLFSDDDIQTFKKTDSNGVNAYLGCVLMALHTYHGEDMSIRIEGNDTLKVRLDQARNLVLEQSMYSNDVLWLDSQLWKDNSAEPQKDVEGEPMAEQAAITDVPSDQCTEITEEEPKKKGKAGRPQATNTIEKVCPEHAEEFRARVEKIVDKESPQEYLDIAKDLGISAKAMKFCVANDLGYPGGDSNVRKWNSARSKREGLEEIDRKKKEKQATARE